MNIQKWLMLNLNFFPNTLSKAKSFLTLSRLFTSILTASLKLNSTKAYEVLQKLKRDGRKAIDADKFTLGHSVMRCEKRLSLIQL